MAYTSIDDPTLYFNTKLYAGNASTQSITGVGFQPDWVWFKARNNTDTHAVFDNVRGVQERLIPNNDSAEGTQSNGLTSFDSDGFSIGDAGIVNQSYNYVSWNWLASNTTASNTDGSITSSVSASTDAGFSIVSWTGNGSTATIGHGLGSAPKVVIIKSRDSSAAWFVGHQSLDASAPWTKYMTLENTNAINDDVIWNDTDPTSNVFSVGSYSSTNGSGVKFIGYCFAEKKGYSKFGSYTGNGNADGTFVYTGFKPAFLLLKRTDSSGGWYIVDNKRNTFNPLNLYLQPDSTNGDSTFTFFDFYSNGFKNRSTGADANASGSNIIYMAFAESPFVTSTGVPACAR